MAKPKLILEFKNTKLLNMWLGAYLDGGGENCFDVACDDSDLSWEQTHEEGGPALVIRCEDGRTY